MSDKTNANSPPPCDEDDKECQERRNQFEQIDKEQREDQIRMGNTVVSGKGGAKRRRTTRQRKSRRHRRRATRGRK